jgi:hypothetical protein
VKEPIDLRIRVANKGNITKLFSYLQSPGRAYQIYALLRQGTLLLAALSIPVLGSSKSAPATYELLWLLGSSVSFFWATAWLDAFWVSAKAATATDTPRIERTAFWGGQFFSLLSAAILLGLLRTLYPDKVGLPLALSFTAFLLGELGSQSLAFSYLLRGRGGALIVWGFLGHGGFLLIVVAGMLGGWDLAQVFEISAVISLAKWGFAFYATQAGWPIVDKALGFGLLRQALPLVLVAVVAQGGGLLDGYLVVHFYDDQFAQFRYGSKELPLVLILANALSLTHAGEIASALRREAVAPALAALRRASARLLSWSAPLTILLLLGSDVIFDQILGPDYRSAVPVFDFCLLLSLPRAWFPQAVVRGYQHNYALTRSAVFELVIKVGLSLWWMSLWGVPGLALATVVGLFFEKVYLALHCHYRLHIGLDRYTPTLSWLFWAGCCFGCIAWKYFLGLPWLPL